MKKADKNDNEGGCPLWVVTFGDAMSLLVTFFVMLVSFADFEEHQLQTVFGGLKGGLRASPLPMAIATSSMTAPAIVEEDQEVPDSDVILGNEKMLKPEKNQRIMKNRSVDYYIHLLANGVSLVIDHRAVFESGTATLSASAHEVWDLAMDMITTVNNEVRICVTLPKNIVVRIQEYSTPWGLGIEQALTVQKLLIKRSGRSYGSVSTSVRVVDSMPQHAPIEGYVEIVFVGYNELLLKGTPGKILKESWWEASTSGTEKEDGQGS